MLKVICPIDGTVHHADEVHAGKMLRCSKCSRVIQIGPTIDAHSTVHKVHAGGRSATSSRPHGCTAHRHACCALLIVPLVLSAWLYTHPTEHPALPTETEQTSVPPITQIPSHPTPVAASIPPLFEPWISPGDNIKAIRRTLKTGTRIRPDIDADGRGILTIDKRRRTRREGEGDRACSRSSGT